jgi:hypothetical protein
MQKRYLKVNDATGRYGPTPSAWRKWIRNDQLGSAVIRCGKLVFLDSLALDKRLAKTGQLLVSALPSDGETIRGTTHSQRARRRIATC